MQKNPLTSKVALVTGAARRIGAEIARTLHDAGMNVVLHFNASEDEAIKLCESLNHIRKESATILRAELEDAESARVLVRKAHEKWGRLDVLVNNASRFYRTHMGEVTDYAWNDLMNSNLKAPFFLSQEAATYLKETNGSIVNITDIHADRPIRDYAVYCISKAGLITMTHVLAKELGPNVRVNGVSPGAIIWPEGENKLTETDKEKIIDRITLKREGSPKDIAKAVLYFVRDADYVTGQIINVDGGRLLSG